MKYSKRLNNYYKNKLRVFKYNLDFINQKDLKVDLIDYNNVEIIEKNVILHHGNTEEDFDKRLWSFNGDKENIRAVITEIK